MEDLPWFAVTEASYSYKVPTVLVVTLTLWVSSWVTAQIILCTLHRLHASLRYPKYMLQIWYKSVQLFFRYDCNKWRKQFYLYIYPLSTVNKISFCMNHLMIRIYVKTNTELLVVHPVLCYLWEIYWLTGMEQ